MDMVFIVTVLSKAAKYLDRNGGSEVIKKSVNDLYGWIKAKLSRKSQKKKIEDVMSDPNNKKKVKQLDELLKDAIEDNELNKNELIEKIKYFERILQQNDSSWYKANLQDPQNTLNISGDHNIGIQDTPNSKIIINKRSNP